MSGSTVLIVDDEQSLARSAKAFLADHGYEAEVAGTGEEALELLATLQPDVVFADVRLPGMSGLDLLNRIRAFDPVIPVIMLTAYGSIEGAVEAVKLGAFDYVKKPVDLEELKLLADRARENRLLKQELSYYRSRATRDVGFEELVGRFWMSCAVTLVTGVVDCVVTCGAGAAKAGVAEAAIKIAPVCRAVAARRLR